MKLYVHVPFKNLSMMLKKFFFSNFLCLIRKMTISAQKCTFNFVEIGT